MNFAKYLIDKVTFTSFLVVTVVLGSFGLIFTLMFHEVPKDSQAVVYSLLGTVVGTGLGSILQFKFGSSSGSEKKTDSLIANMEK